MPSSNWPLSWEDRKDDQRLDFDKPFKKMFFSLIKQHSRYFKNFWYLAKHFELKY